MERARERVNTCARRMRAMSSVNSAPAASSGIAPSAAALVAARRAAINPVRVSVLVRGQMPHNSGE